MARLLTLFALLLCAGCPRPPQHAADADTRPEQPRAGNAGSAKPQAAGPVRVWADPALRHGLDALESRFRSVYADGWEISWVERGELLDALPAEQPPAAGARAQDAAAAEGQMSLSVPAGQLQPQVLLVADTELADKLRTAEVIDEPLMRTFAGDRLAVAQRADDRWPVSSIYDIPMFRFKQLGLGDPQTTFGWLTAHVLASSGIEPRIEGRTSVYANLDELVTALKQAKLDMAIIPASSLVGHELQSVTVVPADMHAPLRYIAAPVAGSASDPGVLELLRLLAEDAEVQQLWTGYGYLDRQTALEQGQ